MRLRLHALFSAIASLCLLPSLASAQVPAGFVLVTQTGLRNSDGTLASNVSVCAQAIVKGQSISVRVGSGGGVTTTSQVCANVSNGTWSMALPDTSQTAPLNATFSLTAIDNVSGYNLLAGYGAVQPTTLAGSPGGWCDSGTCVLDKLAPDVSPLALIQRGPTGPAGPSGCVGVSGCSGDFNPASLNGFEVHFQKYPGATLQDQYTAAKTAWAASATPLLFVLDSPAALGAAISTRAGDALLFNANVTFNAAVTLSDSARARCGAGVALSVGTSLASPFVTAGGNGISIEGCTATTAKTGTALNGSALITTTGGSNIVSRGNILTGMAAGNFNGTNDVTVASNWVNGTDAGYGYGAVSAGNGSRISVTGNHFSNVRVGFEVFNADVDPTHGGPTTRSAVLALGGFYTTTGNIYTNVGAGSFYSGAHDISDVGNVLNGCGDVGYDYEGVVDAVASANVAKNCSNGAGTTFFFSQNVHFSDNDFSSTTGQSLIRVYNASQNAGQNTGLMATNNRLHCESVQCQALGGDAAGNPYIAGNVVTDGFVAWNTNISGGTYRNNAFSYTMASTHPPLSTGNVVAGYGAVLIDGNTFTSSVAQSGSLAAIYAGSGDYNNANSLFIRNNQMLGGFPVDMQIASAGGNGGVGVNATLIENWEGSNNVVLSPSKGADVVTEPIKYIPNGGVWKPVYAGAFSGTCTTTPTVVNGIITGC